MRKALCSYGVLAQALFVFQLCSDPSKYSTPGTCNHFGTSIQYVLGTTDALVVLGKQLPCFKSLDLIQ